VQRLKFLISINITIISVKCTFNLIQKIVRLCVWLLMRVCERMCRDDDEVFDEEAGDKVMSVVDDSRSDECSTMDTL